MTEDDVQISDSVQEEILDLAFGEISTANNRNYHRWYRKIANMIETVYKKGVVAGYHQGNGDNILNNINTTEPV